MRFTHRSATFAGIALVAVAALTGCTASDAGSSSDPTAGSGEPPTAAACDAAFIELESINETVDEITAEMSTGDMSRAPELYDAMASSLDAAEQALGPADVTAIFDTMREGVDGMRAASEGATSIEELSANEQFVSASTTLDEGGAELTALCS